MYTNYKYAKHRWIFYETMTLALIFLIKKFFGNIFPNLHIFWKFCGKNAKIWRFWQTNGKIARKIEWKPQVAWIFVKYSPMMPKESNINLTRLTCFNNSISCLAMKLYYHNISRIELSWGVNARGVNISEISAFCM